MIRVAVIGVGSMGKNHARVYSELAGVDLVAVADGDRALVRAVAEASGCSHYSDYTEMLKEEEIDGLSIAVPTRFHAKVAMDCIGLGKNVLVEKPIAHSPEKAREMIEAARKKGVILTIGHIERFNPGVVGLKKLIDTGGLGDVTSITARRVGVFPPQIKDANVIMDLAVHDVDIFSYLLGTQPTEVYTKSGVALGADREDHAILTLSYGGVPCVSQVNWITPVKIRGLAVTGSGGYAELNYITQELKVFKSNYERTYDSFGDFVVKFGSPEEVVVNVEKSEPLKEELSHFIRCIKGVETPIVTGKEGLTSLITCLAAIESYKKDLVVEVDCE